MSAFEAVEKSDCRKLEAALDVGADPNSKNDFGETLLGAAAELGNVAIGLLLLERGAEPNFAGFAWPMHLAAGNGHKDFVELLLQYESEVHCLDEEGSTPLADACAGGHANVVSLLLEAGADPTHKDRSGKRPVMYAAENGHAEVVTMLAPYSSKREQERLALLLKFADGECSDEYDEIDGLIMANNIEKIQSYLEDGGNANAMGLGGGSLLQSAAQHGGVEIIHLLLRHGADPNHLEEYGSCALDHAIRAPTREAFDILAPLTNPKLRKRAEGYVERKREAGFLNWDS